MIVVLKQLNQIYTSLPP